MATIARINSFLVNSFTATMSGLQDTSFYTDVAEHGTEVTWTLDNGRKGDLEVRVNGEVVANDTNVNSIAWVPDALAYDEQTVSVYAGGTLVASSSYTIRHEPPVYATQPAATNATTQAGTAISINKGTTSSLGIDDYIETLTIDGTDYLDDAIENPLTYTLATAGFTAYGVNGAISVRTGLVNSGGSVLSNTVSGGTLVDVPNAIVTATATSPSNNVIRFTFTAPDNGNSAITSYEYRVDGAGAWVALGGTTSPQDTAAVVLGGDRTVEIRAVNAVGAGVAWQSGTIAVAALSTPNQMAAPTFGAVTASSIVVTRGTAPADNGSAITSYTLQISSDGGQSWSTVTSSFGATATVTDLVGSTSYRFRQFAVNGLGAGVPSAAGIQATTAAATFSLTITGPQDGNGDIPAEYAISTTETVRFAWFNGPATQPTQAQFVAGTDGSGLYSPVGGLLSTSLAASGSATNLALPASLTRDSLKNLAVLVNGGATPIWIPGIDVTTSAPILLSSTPADNATDVGTTATIVLNFDADMNDGVQVNASGLVKVYATSGAVLLETFDIATGIGDDGGTIVASAGDLTTDRITVTLGASLSNSAGHYVNAELEDDRGNVYSLTGSTALNFTTIASGSNPYDPNVEASIKGHWIGNTGVTINGSGVDPWVGTASGNSLGNGTNSQRPTYSSPVLTFDGGTQNLAMTSRFGLSANPDLTVVMLIKVESTPNSNGAAWALGNNSPQIRGVVNTTGIGFATAGSPSGQIYFGAAPSAASGYHIMIWHRSASDTAADQEFRLDGSQVTATSTTNGTIAPTDTGAYFSIGEALAGSNHARANISVVEVLVFNSNDVATLIPKVEGYLAHKWDGSYSLLAKLPGGHPYKSTAPTA